MRRGHGAAAGGLACVLLVTLCGCKVGGATSVQFAQTKVRQAAVPAEADAVVPAAYQAQTAGAASVGERSSAEVAVSQPLGVSARDVDAASPSAPAPLPPPASFAAEQLEVEALVAEVLSINPDIQSALAAWRAAAQRYPQAVSLDDPMFGYMLGPGSWGSPEVNNAYTLEASQKLPWPGKRQLRGDIARAEANAAYFDAGEQRLRIAEVARRAYYEYFLAHRQLAVLAESTDLLHGFREAARSRYEAAAVEQQDVLLADLELAEQQRRLVELTRAEQVSRARINTLLLSTPDAPLPPPPASLEADRELLPAEQLRQTALAGRPELAAQAARIRAERYAVDLACKEFYPDLEVVGRYDAFWQEHPLRTMVGVNLNLPLNKRKRWAAVAEARANVARRQSELDARVNEIAFEVEQAYRQVEESRQTVEVFRERIIPTARHSIDAARASYLAGRLDFLRLIEAQRQLLSQQDRYYEAVAAYFERLAELDRLVGAPSAVEAMPIEG
jgi:outer membrane protein TolC